MLAELAEVAVAVAGAGGTRTGQRGRQDARHVVVAGGACGPARTAGLAAACAGQSPRLGKHSTAAVRARRTAKGLGKHSTAAVRRGAPPRGSASTAPRQ